MSDQRLVSINMTNFFNRELFMYSLGDIRFKKPVSLRKVAYTTAFLIIWTLPIVLIFGIHFNIIYFALILAPPFLMGNFASKPMFGGKTLIEWAKSTVRFMGEPKGWTDLNPSKTLDSGQYFVESEIWISRRRELQYLMDQREKKMAKGLKK
jgi:hypothetical protein